MAATGASGTNTVRYGTMRENVLALEVVLADGRVIRTGTRARKSSAGYDLTHLFIGSEGALGIITELTVRLRPIPEAISAAVCSFPTTAGRGCDRDRDRPVRRADRPLRAARRDDDGRRQRPRGVGRAEAPTLFLEFHGSPTGVEEDARYVEEMAREQGGGDFAWATAQRGPLAAVACPPQRLLRRRRPAARLPVVTTDVCVPVSRAGGHDRRDDRRHRHAAFPAPLLGHVADGNFHVMLLLDPDDPAEPAGSRGRLRPAGRARDRRRRHVHRRARGRPRQARELGDRAARPSGSCERSRRRWTPRPAQPRQGAPVGVNPYRPKIRIAPHRLT